MNKLESYLRDVAAPGQRVNPLFTHLGIEVESICPDAAVLRMPARQEHMQGAGVLAGGMIATLLDEAMAHVVIANIAGKEDIRQTATIELSTRFLGRVVLGRTLRARAGVLKLGKQIVTVEAEALDEDALVAKASASFMIISG